MSSLLVCGCGQKLKTGDSLAGKRVKCPTCGRLLDVPMEAQIVQPTPRPWNDPPQNQPSAYPQQTPSHFGPAPNHQPRGGLGTGAICAIVGGVVVGVFGFVIVFVLLLVSSDDEWAKSTNSAQVVAVETPKDYAEARKSFRTNLWRREKSPQFAGRPVTPPGAEAASYRSGDLTLKAFVDPSPGDGKRRPAVLFLHGGFAFGEGDWEMPQAYRDAGYIVMIPVLRGENLQAGTYTYFYDEVDDVIAAADALGKLDYVDAERIFVAGHSAGGTLAVLAAMASDRFVAAASFSGSMDQTVYPDERDLCPFDPEDEREVAMRSPIQFATSFKCPARLYYGSDERWAADVTRQTASAARSAGLDVVDERVMGDHFSSVAPAIQRSILFFRQFHPPGNEPTPIVRAEVTDTQPAVSGFRPPQVPRPTVPRPTVPDAGSTRSRATGAVVVFEIIAYEGREPALFAARRSLAGISWVNPVAITVDTDKNEIVVGVLGTSLSTGQAKANLQQNGFTIGSTAYMPQGR